LISFIISIIGIFILFLLLINLDIKIIKIKDITNELLNRKVKITGEVVRISNYKAGFQLLNVREDMKEIEIFVETGKNISLSKSDKIIVLGKVLEYENKLQIRAEKINRLNLK